MGICESKEDAAAVPSEPSEGFRKGEGSNVTDKVQNVGELMTNKFRTQAHHLKNVFAAPIEMVSPQYKPPVFEKSSEEQAFIKDALKHNFVFEGVSDKEFDVIIAAHEPYDVDKNATIIMEGDKGDYFYVLREGRVKFVKGDNQVGKGREGASFGELALLYSAPRAASVISTTPCKLYRLDQITFRSILQSHTLSEDKEKMDLLRSINFLQDLDPRDVHKLAAAMKPRKYQAGATILNKGDEGDVFYVIVSGKVRVTDITAGNAKYEDLELGKGRYFGERALITNEKRAATIFAVEPTKTLTIDKKTFVRVLGDYGSLVLRKQDKLKLVSSFVFFVIGYVPLVRVECHTIIQVKIHLIWISLAVCIQFECLLGSNLRIVTYPYTRLILFSPHFLSYSRAALRSFKIHHWSQVKWRHWQVLSRINIIPRAKSLSKRYGFVRSFPARVSAPRVRLGFVPIHPLI